MEKSPEERKASTMNRVLGMRLDWEKLGGIGGRGELVERRLKETGRVFWEERFEKDLQASRNSVEEIRVLAGEEGRVADMENKDKTSGFHLLGVADA